MNCLTCKEKDKENERLKGVLQYILRTCVNSKKFTTTTVSGIKRVIKKALKDRTPESGEVCDCWTEHNERVLMEGFCRLCTVSKPASKDRR